jgi:hypothetical protein
MGRLALRCFTPSWGFYLGLVFLNLWPSLSLSRLYRLRSEADRLSRENEKMEQRLQELRDTLRRQKEERMERGEARRAWRMHWSRSMQHGVSMAGGYSWRKGERGALRQHAQVRPVATEIKPAHLHLARTHARLSWRRTTAGAAPGGSFVCCPLRHPAARKQAQVQASATDLLCV